MNDPNLRIIISDWVVGAFLLFFILWVFVVNCVSGSKCTGDLMAFFFTCEKALDIYDRHFIFVLHVLFKMIYLE